MSTPSVQEEELHAFVDGQLPKGRCTAVLAYLGQHPQEIARLAAYAIQKEELRHRLQAIDSHSYASTVELEQALADRLSGAGYRVWLRRVAVIAGLLAVGWSSNEIYRQYLAARLPDVVVEAALAHQNLRRGQPSTGRVDRGGRSRHGGLVLQPTGRDRRDSIAPGRRSATGRRSAPGRRRWPGGPADLRGP